MSVIGTSHTFAQLDPDEMGFFNHLSVGVSAGTDGIGIQLAAPLSPHFSLRAGYSFFPNIDIKADIDLGKNPAFINGEGQKIDLSIDTKLNQGNVLFDYYPSLNSSFHITAGAYFGNSNILSVGNKEQFIRSELHGKAGINLASEADPEYTIVTDADGNIKVDLSVNSLRPYLGIGFGRAVPRKRIGLQFDLGVQFWGTPKVKTNLMYKDYSQGEYVRRYEKVDHNRITNPGSDYKDIKDNLKDLSKLAVYPMLTLRLNGRLF